MRHFTTSPKNTCFLTGDDQSSRRSSTIGLEQSRHIMPMYSIHEEQYYAYDGNEGDNSKDYENVDSDSRDYSDDGYCYDGNYDAPEYSNYQSPPCIHDCVYAYDYSCRNSGCERSAFYCRPTLRNGDKKIMFLNSSGPPQRTYSKDILIGSINDFVTYIPKEGHSVFYDSGYSHGIRPYESDTKNAY